MANQPLVNHTAVSIGLWHDGLAHLSQRGNVRHPLEVVRAGENVEVRVLGVDTERGRVSLTLKL